MPVSNRSNRITLEELIEMRKASPALPANTAIANGALSERFLVPPFSILDARQGYWQKRKKMWLELGIKSELGRGEAYPTGSPYSKEVRSHCHPNVNKGRKKRTNRAATSFNCAVDLRPPKNGEAWAVDDNLGSGTSIFDPVLCELAYRWFCPPDGLILDPFAGGSVRGVVAAKLGRSYTGMDLRREQAEANEDQARDITPGYNVRWVVGDARGVTTLCPGEYDFLFSCPPYADLERYSDDPRDLSTLKYPDFLRGYTKIVVDCCSMLKENRFACFVVGDVRDADTGIYYNFIGDTVNAFRVAGLGLYNEAILITAAGSLPVRVGHQFSKYRKLGKTHQQVLVFVKGDGKRAAEICGEVDVDDLAMPEYKKGAVVACRHDVHNTLLEQYLACAEDESEDDVGLVDLDQIEACLLCDVVRVREKAEGRSMPRIWVGVDGKWRRVWDNEEMTSIVRDIAYLNRNIFPDSIKPIDLPLNTGKMRGT